MNCQQPKGQTDVIVVVAGVFCAHRRAMHDPAPIKTKQSVTQSGAVPHMDAPPLRRAIPRTVLRIALLIALGLAFHAALGWLMMRVETLDTAADRATIWAVLALLLVGYAILIAIPFMPGIEIGLALMVFQGASIAPFVYLATVAGLAIAYGVGRIVPLGILHNAFRDLHLRRACELVAEIENTPQDARLARLQGRLPAWLARLVVNYRYVMLAVLVNIPGSFAIGGGGGILMLAGISRLFRWPAILATLAIATLPVPLAVYQFGPDAFNALFG
ncbi:hypothetical protein [Yoonia sp. 208BN28-4]|uniref:hypothetical protein n=1 Tax=Yoonia sp. 208BN28-4 TaxID=3126505 RepID=UPI0030AC4279